MTPVVSGADIFLQPDIDVVEDHVPQHATLAGILRDHQLSEELIVAMVDATRDVFDPRRLRAGQPYRMVRTLDGPFRRFEYDIDGDRFLRVVSHRGEVPELEVEIVPFVKERAEIAMHGEIDPESSSLVAAVIDGGESVLLAIAMAEVFAGEIDFNNDLRRGDSFDVLFERLLRKDEYVGYGSIRAAEFNNDGRRIRAIRFTPPGGEPAYYDEQGRSLRKLFLRSPVQVRAAHHLSLLLPSVASGARRDRSTPRCRLWRAPWDASHRGRERGGCVGGSQRAARVTWCGSATRMATKRITCTFRPSPTAFGRGRGSPKVRRSVAWARPVSQPVRTSTFA